MSQDASQGTTSNIGAQDTSAGVPGAANLASPETTPTESGGVAAAEPTMDGAAEDGRDGVQAQGPAAAASSGSDADRDTGGDGDGNDAAASIRGPAHDTGADGAAAAPPGPYRGDQGDHQEEVLEHILDEAAVEDVPNAFDGGGAVGERTGRHRRSDDETEGDDNDTITAAF